ncbi:MULTISPECIES: MFS transporter [Paenibacillus]|uniref:MFS transporter n=1 Tax=Paenibacillus TaxID=44249 RepID=UPI0022B88229|nr:MFS transporter [Paenibacillus caseinilyticus]MCZ8520454.1 MFS transporter [Paenibacillus caseinilyticus]
MPNHNRESRQRAHLAIKAFNFFVYGAIAVYTSYFPLYLLSQGMSKMEIGALIAGGPFISIFANPFWGYWSDRLQQVKRILLVMLAGNLAVMQLVFASREYLWIYGFMLLFFFFQMPLFSQSNALILNSIEGTRHKFGAFRLWGSLGWGLLAAAGGPLIGMLGIGRLWIVYSALLSVAIIFALSLPKGDTGQKASFSNQGYRGLFRNRPFLMLMGIGVLVSIPNSMNAAFIPIYISELGGDASLIGLSAFLSSIFEIPVFLLLDRYLKKDAVTMVTGLILVSLLFALRWLLMSAAGHPYQLLAVQTLNSLTFGGYYYIGTQLTASLVPAAYRSSGQAAYALTWGGLSGIAAGLFGGWLFQEQGPAVMYGTGMWMSLAGAAGFLLMLQRVRRTQPSADRDRDSSAQM